VKQILAKSYLIPSVIRCFLAVLESQYEKSINSGLTRSKSDWPDKKDWWPFHEFLAWIIA